jgi:carboxyl-terminal processing protease
MSPERRRGFISGLIAGAAGGLAVAGILVLIIGPTLAGVIDRVSEAVGGGGDRTSDARERIEDSYFKPVSGNALENASINGMIRALRERYGDKFSHYLDPAALREFDAATSGHFSGVGLTVNEVKRGLRVADVLPNTPAERAEIKPGAVITRVNSRSIAGVPADVSSTRIKGPPGTPVELRIVPPHGGRAQDVTLRRAAVEVPAVHGRIAHAAGQKVAYVRFSTFSSGAHGELRSAVERLYRDGAQGLVLDLRGNGGGLLNEGVLSASLFLKKGDLVVATNSRTMGHHDYEAVGGRLEPRPMIVLINHDTASAAEILASAAADHHVATTVGTRSYGKGTFQEVMDLDAGGALDLTVGEYLTADGTSLAGKGIKPEVRAADRPSTPTDEALRRGLAILGQKLSR